MKKFLIVVVVIIMSLSLTACGKLTPSETIKANLDAYIKQDSKILNGQKFDATMLGLKEDQIDADIESAFKKISDISYEILDEKIDGDKATVSVKVESYDFGIIFDEVKNRMSNWTSQGLNENQITSEFGNIVKEKVGAQTKRTKTWTFDIPLTQKNGVWEIDDITSNTEFLDALSGGIYSSALAFTNSFK